MWPWIPLPANWHHFGILFSNLWKKGRLMCTVPSPVPHFWQSLIFWPCSALIKCLLPNTVGRFSGFTPISEAVSYTEECTHRPALRPGSVGSALTLASTHGIPHSLASALRCLLVLPVLFMLSAVIWNLCLGEQLQTSISERGSLSQSLWLS